MDDDAKGRRHGGGLALPRALGGGLMTNAHIIVVVCACLGGAANVGWVGVGEWVWSRWVG